MNDENTKPTDADIAESCVRITRVYLVIQTGVFRHDICGVYTSPAGAEAAAKRAAAEDVDSYHGYSVHETTLTNAWMTWMKHRVFRSS